MTDLILDEAPQTEEDVLRCTYDGCGVELFYAGKGRKPTKCDEHRRKSTGNSKRGPAEPSNKKLASDALAALMQFEGILAAGMFFAGFAGTASALANANESFETRAYEALLTDPELCRFILRGGIMSGRVLLAFAYASKAATVAPVFMAEFRAMREARAAKREMADVAA